MVTKFNDEITRRIVELHSEGVPIKYCADAVGIHRDTIYDWLNKGKKAKSGKYKKFYHDMQKARSDNIKYHLTKIADSKSWTASQYLLQVMDSETFVVAEKQQVEAKMEADINAKTEVSIFDKAKELDEELREIE